jgi:sugar phosphate isomerase/epimerase
VGYHPGKNEYQKMVGDFWGWRTMMISFAKAENVEISGIELSQTMCWAITFEWSHNVYLHDLAIYSFCKNGDGIDFRSGCHNCKVENLTGYCTDDGVACTALSRGTRYTYPNAKSVYPMTVAAGCVEGYSHDIHDIEIKNVSVGGLHHVIICLAANGDKVYNVKMENIEEGERGAKWSVVCLYTGYGGGYTAGDINNIRINGVHSRNAKYALEFRADMRDIYAQNMYMSSKFVVHASGEPIADPERRDRMECAKRSLKRLAEAAAECGATIAVENLPRTCLGRDSAEVAELISAHPLLRVCFDTNHLLTESHADFLKALGPKIVTTHISDYDFVDERHLLPGEGKIDWKKFISDLVASGAPTGWIYEVPPKNTKNIERVRELTPLDLERCAFEIFNGDEITRIEGKLLF